MTGANLTSARLRELLEYDPQTGVFTWLADRGRMAKAGDVAGSLHHHGYVVIRIDGAIHRAHRLAWLYMHGFLPVNEIDHRNGIRSDNRSENLREATKAQNMGNQLNSHARSKSKILGVRFHKRDGKWTSEISTNKKRHYLGLFETAELAEAAYLAAKRAMHNF